MVYLSVFLVLFLSSGVLSDADNLFSSCHINDSDCIEKATQEFFTNISSGISEHDIKPLDPLVIPNLEISHCEKSDIVLHFKDLTITGLKDTQLSQFKVNTSINAAELHLKSDLNIIGEVTIEMKKISKSFTGSYEAKGTVLGAIKYNFSVQIDDNGDEHFDIKPGTQECQSFTEPQVSYGKDLLETLKNDKDLQGEQYYTNQVECEKKIFCEIVSNAYKTVAHNIRATAKLVKKHEFLKGVLL